MLVQAGAGWVGLAAIQVAKRAGATVMTNGSQEFHVSAIGHFTQMS